MKLARLQCCALAAMLCLPAISFGQEDINSKVDMILKNMVTRDDIKGLVTQEQLKAEVDKLSTVIAEQDAEIKELRNDLSTTAEVLNQQVAEQKEIIDVISRPDSQGNPILALNNISQNSPEFKQELSQAVNNSIGQEGNLVVENKTAFGRHLKINNERTEYIPANTVSTFKVKIGTVTTELVGQEAPKNWTITAPTYQQKVDIEPATSSQIVVQRQVVDTTPVVVRREVVNVTPAPVVVRREVVNVTPAPVVVQSVPVYTPTVAYYAPTTTAYYAPTTTYRYPVSSFYYGGYYRGGVFGTGLFGWRGYRGISRRYYRRNPVSVY